MNRGRLLLLAAGLALSGCGLRPLYGGGSSGPVAAQLTDIDVGPIPTRSGWLVRNALVDRMGRGEQTGARYRLVASIDDDLTSFGIRGDSAATRERRTLRLRYQLVEATSGLVLIDATAGADAGIDVVSSEYATVAAEQSAAERLAADVADQVVARIGLYFRRAGGSDRR